MWLPSAEMATARLPVSVKASLAPSGIGMRTMSGGLGRVKLQKARAVTPTAATTIAAIVTRRCQRAGSAMGAGADAWEASGSSWASAISSRAVPISGSRCFWSRSRHRLRSRRTECGVSDGNSAQSTSCRSTAASVSDTVWPVNVGCPASISNSTHPKAQMSARLSTGFPRACSGDMYAAVPMITPICVAAAVSVGDWLGSPSGLGSSAFANPKSSTLTVPSSRTLMFAGLRSRWITPASCAASSASAICLPIGSASSSGIGPFEIRSARVGPSTSSSTSARVPSASSMPWMAAMLGWLRLARICASRVNRASRSGSAAKASGRIFSATWRPSWVSVACQTWPIPPSPMRAVTS